MKQFVVRGLVTLGLVASLGLGVSGVASAGNGPGTTPAPTMRVYRQEMAAYKASRAAIEATFRSNVDIANAIYERSLSSATTSAQRSVAEQTRVQAIIQAASTRTSALVTLGNAPTPPNS
jgi:hypothetical protein